MAANLQSAALTMSVPDIPPDELERFHFNYGDGKGALGYRHLPSGITIVRDTGTVSNHALDRELLAGLKAKLVAAGILPKAGESH